MAKKQDSEPIPHILGSSYCTRHQAGEIILVRVCNLPYDEALEELKDQNCREVSLAENAKFRVQSGTDSGLSQRSNLVREEILYIPNERGAFLTKSPATSKSPEEATQAHRDKREFYPTKRQVEEARANSIRIYGAAYHTAGVIPFNRFGSNKTMVYAFGTTNGKDTRQDSRDAQNYANLVRKTGLEKMVILLEDEEYVNRQSRPFARKVSFTDVTLVWIQDDKSLDSCWLLGVPDSDAQRIPEDILRKLKEGTIPEDELRKLTESKIPEDDLRELKEGED